MGRVEEFTREQLFDVEETIFVAVGKYVRENKSTLAWAIRSFPGKKICLLHVHQPPQLAVLTDRKSLAYKLRLQAAKAFRELEKQKLHKLLSQYLLFLSQEGVQGNKVWIEFDSIEKGIIEIISRHDVRWLAMGAAADKYYSKLKENAELKSKKAIFVCQQAPSTCHIWFPCKGYLIYTRRPTFTETEEEFAPKSDIETEKLENLTPEFCELELTTLPDHVCQHGSIDCHSQLEGVMALSTTKGPMGINVLQRHANTEDPAEWGGGLSGSGTSTFQHLEFSSSLTGKVDGSSKLSASLTNEANMSEQLSADMIQRKKMEGMIIRVKQEVDRMKNQCDDLMKELQMAQDQRSALESRVANSHCVVKDLEEKIISAVELLIPMKEKRDELRIENDNATREVKGLKNLARKEAVSFLRPQFLEFSFSEIIEATNNFDPSQKIGEGRCGNTFKGFLHHIQVAIKMLPSYGSLDDLAFQREVELLSRVRHPNLVTLVGTCPESRSLVYEYLKNGSLEDRLACKGNTLPLSWQTRTQIATDICSVLIFLHSNNPYIVHGNLKPSNILLDSNFVCKLSDLGVLHMLPQNQRSTSVGSITNSGELTPESDVCSFGIILLFILTGRQVLEIIRCVKCALKEERFNEVLDFSAGDWPVEEAQNLACLALRCCEKRLSNELDLLLEILSVLELMRISRTASASHLASKGNRRIPSYFVCPIFQEIMKDPRIAADGFTYEAEAIEEWFKSGHDTSPMTNLKLEDCSLHPNHALHNAIQEWLHQP